MSNKTDNLIIVASIIVGIHIIVNIVKDRNINFDLKTIKCRND